MAFNIQSQMRDLNVSSFERNYYTAYVDNQELGMGERLFNRIKFIFHSIFDPENALVWGKGMGTAGVMMGVVEGAASYEEETMGIDNYQKARDKLITELGRAVDRYHPASMEKYNTACAQAIDDFYTACQGRVEQITGSSEYRNNSTYIKAARIAIEARILSIPDLAPDSENSVDYALDEIRKRFHYGNGEVEYIPNIGEPEEAGVEPGAVRQQDVTPSAPLSHHQLLKVEYARTIDTLTAVKVRMGQVHEQLDSVKQQMLKVESDLQTYQSMTLGEGDEDVSQEDLDTQITYLKTQMEKHTNSGRILAGQLYVMSLREKALLEQEKALDFQLAKTTK